MYVGYLQKDAEGVVSRVKHSEHSTREEAHTAAVALADSLADSTTVIQVERGYPIDETTYVPRVVYNVPPTDEQRNPS